MSKEKIKVYLYTRVSTAMQIDGYSLEAQKTKMKAFCDYNEYEIAGEYEDAGKSGKSIEGRIAFNQMMDDIKSGKDAVSYVLVFKLSRFGRNAADVLATLQVMQDFGVNLICVEDGIDSSKDAGKLMISVLSAVAEIERENIRVQTMEGRMQKAREGKWNGGFAPYGYSLIDGKLEVNEEEAVAIRTIFDQYVNTDLGANGIAKYLENHGIHKIARQNGTNPLFDAALIRRIIQNPVYCGKISYGRRRTEKVHGTRNEYRQVRKELLVYWDDEEFDFSNKRIIKMTLFGDEIATTDVTDAYKKIHSAVYDFDPAEYLRVINTVSGGGDIRCPYMVANGVYITTNISSQAKMENIQRLFEAFGFESKDLIFEVRDIPKALKFDISDEKTYCVLKVGELAKRLIGKALVDRRITEEEIALLHDKNYSKRLFPQNYYPVLADSVDAHRSKSKTTRYYKDPVIIDGREIFVSSQWFEDDRDNLLEWYRNHS